jgi:hypothetical protein
MSFAAKTFASTEHVLLTTLNRCEQSNWRLNLSVEALEASKALLISLEQKLTEFTWLARSNTDKP